jgi:hypothetical protein
MALNILEALRNEFGDEIVGMLGKFIGEDSSKTKAALGAAFPAILGGLVNKARRPGRTEILEMIRRAASVRNPDGGWWSAFAGGARRRISLPGGAELLKRSSGRRGRHRRLVAGAAGIGKNSAPLPAGPRRSRGPRLPGVGRSKAAG